mmetsp:Transcript_19574/g.60496  ORF Transcript_19574/g.60496 Transcript_19574/m.60496 type:complete len:148 (+) Transcript_19574:82-525(+)
MNWYYLSNGGTTGGLGHQNVLRRHRVSPSRPGETTAGKTTTTTRSPARRMSSSFSLIDCFRLCCETMDDAARARRRNEDFVHRERLLARRRQLNAQRAHSPLSLEGARRPSSLTPLPSLTEDEEVFFSVDTKPTPQGSPVSSTATIS